MGETAKLSFASQLRAIEKKDQNLLAGILARHPHQEVISWIGTHKQSQPERRHSDRIAIKNKTD